MTAAVRGVMAAATASTSIWKVCGSAGTSTQVAPAVSIHTRYSGKYGAMTMTSSPGQATAWSAHETDAAAPTVMKMSAMPYDVPKRRLSESATAWRASGTPGAGV